MNNETTTTSTTDTSATTMSKPTRLWLWCLATIQLFAVIFILSGCSADINTTAEAILREGIPEHFEKNGMGGYLKIVAIKDVALIKKSGNTYKGLANVKFETAKGESASKTIQYDLSGTFDGDQLLLEFKPSDSDSSNLIELFEKAGYSE